MADTHDYFRERLARIRHDVMALKWRTEELIKVSRQLIWTHHQLVEEGRTMSTNRRGGGETRQARD